MTSSVLSFVRNYSQEPSKVDKLIVSAFVSINKLEIENNKFIKTYLIQNKKLLEFTRLIKLTSNEFSFEELINLFEYVVSPADKIVTGAVYTPVNIRDFIIFETLAKKKGAIAKVKICDLSCGCGGFLFSAIKYIKSITKHPYSYIINNNIYGLDINDYSITRTKILLSLLAISEGEDKELSFNFFIGDALSFSFTDNIINFAGFDIIVGNPPYVCSRHLSKNTKELMSKLITCKSGHPDLYIPFFQIGLANLAINGILGFITMNSFFKSLNGRSLRSYFHSEMYKFKIIDFGSEQVFNSHNTYTCICFLENTHCQYIEYSRSSIMNLSKKKKYEKVHYNDLNSLKGWNLQNNEVITKIESTGKALGELYRTSHGIATLKNNIYIFTPDDEDSDYFYFEKDGSFQIEKNICKDIINSNRLSRNYLIKDIKEKIIFPYNNESRPCLLDEEYIKKIYPQAYKYLSSKRDILSQRDKGNGNYQNWFAFGRTQALGRVKNKLLFPKMSDRPPNSIICSDEDLFYYNGQAIIDNSIKKLKLIKKIIESRLFWYYITSTSKPYSSNYYSLNGNYVKNFGICELSKEEELFLISEQNKKTIDEFLEKKYGICL
jgi:hypothetical protein